LRLHCAKSGLHSYALDRINSPFWIEANLKYITANKLSLELYRRAHQRRLDTVEGIRKRKSSHDSFRELHLPPQTAHTERAVARVQEGHNPLIITEET